MNESQCIFPWQRGKYAGCDSAFTAVFPVGGVNRPLLLEDVSFCQMTSLTLVQFLSQWIHVVDAESRFHGTRKAA